MTDSEELTDLAEMLERKAKWNDARAAMAPHDPTINPQKEAQGAAYCRGKAEVCRRAAAELSCQIGNGHR